MKTPKLCARTVAGRIYYFTKINSKQHHLGADPEEARKAFARLLLNEPIATAIGRQSGASDHLAPLVQQYLDWLSANRSKATHYNARHYLVDFVRYAPVRLRAGDIADWMIEDWLATRPTWGAAAQANAIGCLKTCLNWHVKRRNLAANPIDKMRKPKYPTRETILTVEMRAAAMAGIRSQSFRDFYFLLCELMVRPFELRTMEAKHVDLARGLVIFKRTEHKTGERTGRERVIYLTPPAAALLADLCERHPAGPLLRNSRGQGWTKSAIVTSFRRLRKRVPTLPRNHTAYCERHTSITGALERGLSDSVVAELAGHADATMVAKVYGHLRSRPAAMLKAALEAASGPRLFVPEESQGQETRGCG